MRASAPLHPSASPQLVLGIDPGLATTGWAVVEKSPSRLLLQAFGAIETSASRTLSDRLLTLKAEVARLLDIYRPGAVAIEELFFTQFATSIAATAQARGVILLAVAEAGRPLHEYNPRAVKIAMTGYGSAPKAQMQQMLQRYFRLQTLPRPDDAADAAAIALCHLQTRRELAVHA